MDLYKLIQYKNFIKSSDAIFQKKVETLLNQILKLRRECQIKTSKNINKNYKSNQNLSYCFFKFICN